ncbi:Putative Binding-protein-dependent transport systems inner membrane component [Thermobacillus xylanilyticus]|jgi:putative aldouronate transport system permease protein|uniref:Binding-protein-dependent transport systems inner membrane component n=1 Tax=Thermobacillus xylanilyticus TaxID=76633 RepID=A0ABM8V9S1_THEXY|nr:carbohydrate ABC transporter permease [Thermobacillus xylanilyticus]CAG5092872.1 Putative Binding-protein-dependent transport systems inner membrane component [Thermobacillus xylanilyticus]
MEIASRGEIIFRRFAFVTMTLISVGMLLPILLMITASFTDEKSLILNGYRFVPDKLSLDAYIYMINQYKVILRAYGVSVLVTVAGTLISLIITTMLAYPMSRRDFKYRNVLAFVVFFTMLFSGGIVPSYMLWTRVFGVTDTYWALILPNLLMPAFHVLLVRNYYQSSIPHDLIESAQIDGAGEFKIFFRIMFPLSVPVVATIGLFMALVYWNDWINALYFISKPKYFGIQNLLIRMMNNIQFLRSSEGSALIGTGAVDLPSTSIRMAMGVVGLLPIMVIFPFTQKYLIKGVVIGAVKG